MDAVRCRVEGNDYVGAFLSTTDRFTFAPLNLAKKNCDMIKKALGTEIVKIALSGCDLIGLLCRANSGGVLLSNMVYDDEVEALKRSCPDMNVEVLESDLNAVGNNVLVNDRICIINPDYSEKERKAIEDLMGVETVKAENGGFKTVGANNILTATGIALNNRTTDSEEEKFEKLTGFKGIRTTANMGGLSIGIACIANSRGMVSGYETTGFELNRIMEALDNK
ncbi:MAG: translation initiation factor IF-6 [Candidatus Marsarchaeota archaeon]|jgi:translation initiation factor 6|nr:translation initiation factor IF-6 [Candidatus Marsarchaeota archaeon]MCL5115184.1 translation initiation factor IF-6 [Candidatus Marsarchaeota archaeon]